MVDLRFPAPFFLVAPNAHQPCPNQALPKDQPPYFPLKSPILHPNSAPFSRDSPPFFRTDFPRSLKKSQPKSFSMKAFSGRLRRNLSPATAGLSLQISATPQKIWRRCHAETVQKSTKLPDPKNTPHQKTNPLQQSVNPYTLPLR